MTSLMQYLLARICWLLDHWMHLYPGDFAVPNTASALSALVKSIVSKTYLLHYGSEFIPFMEILSTLKDQDAAWAMKIAEPKEDSDDAASLQEKTKLNTSSHSLLQPASENHPAPTPSKSVARERKHSLPLSARILVMESSPASGPADSIAHPPKNKLRILVTLSNQFMQTDPTSLAQEISRLECRFFLQIEPRHWLQHVIAQGPKDAETDPITQYNHVSNHVAEW